MTPTDEVGPALVLRPAEAADAPELAEVHLASRRAAQMPPGIHPDDDVRRWIATRLDSTDQVWVAELSGRPVGYARFTTTWLDDLYVLPDAAGQGIGTALLDLVKSLLPDGFGLWVFEMNTPARAFYARHGLVEVERTDGSANEERCPDIAMRFARG